MKYDDHMCVSESDYFPHPPAPPDCVPEHPDSIAWLALKHYWV